MTHSAIQFARLLFRLPRWWVRRIPPHTFRVLAVAVFLGVVLRTTRYSTTPTALQADRPAESAATRDRRVVPAGPTRYAWLTGRGRRGYVPLVERIPPPEGFERIELDPGSFGDWLRHLPVLPGDSPVRTGRGKLVHKADHPSVAAVIGLQPRTDRALAGANILIRLRAEFLWATNQFDALRFHYTSGHCAAWSEWAAGVRPSVKGRNVSFNATALADDSRENFCNYLETLFQYASAYSCLADTEPVTDGTITPGDVFLGGRRSTHAIMVLDIARDGQGRVRALLGRGGVPAQTFHVPAAEPGQPWFAISRDRPIVVPGAATLRLADLRRWRG